MRESVIHMVKKRTRTWSEGLCSLIMQLSQPWMFEGIKYSASLPRVKLKHPLHQVESQRVGIWKLLLEINFLCRSEKQMFKCYYDVCRLFVYH